MTAPQDSTGGRDPVRILADVLGSEEFAESCDAYEDEAAYLLWHLHEAGWRIVRTEPCPPFGSDITDEWMPEVGS